MEILGPIALAGLIFVKEVGIPVPVPGDLLVIGAGVAASQGDLPPLPTVVAVVIASVLGGATQYALVRGGGRRLFVRALHRVGVGQDRIDREASRLRAGGARAVAAARVTPGLRIVAIAASGIAGLPFGPFLLGLAVGNSLFIGAHFSLGLAVGEPAIRLASGAAGVLAIVGVVLAAAGAAGWWYLARRRSRRARTVVSVADWADATCPACLALSTLAPR